jgi:hypothetical protein
LIDLRAGGLPHRWKAFDKGYNFISKLTSIRCFNKKLWASKVVGIPILRILGISGFPT